MLGQYVFAGMKQERLLFIVLIQHALFHVTTCPVLNSQECQRTGCALCATKVHHLTTLGVRFASCENIVSRFETSSLPTAPPPPRVHIKCLSILGDPVAVSRVGRKGGSKVFMYGRKSPWVPTLTELFPKLRADAGS